METRRIKCQNGEQVNVDAQMFEFLNRWKWRVRGGYACRETRVGGRFGKNKTILMHRVVAQTPDGMWTDHKNGDALDNRRSNLRVCTPSQNNSYRRSTNSLGKGVQRVGSRYKAVAFKKHVGYFDTREEAARAYMNVARQKRGTFAKC